jgi:cysteinyl-tRNA synthetase
MSTKYLRTDTIDIHAGGRDLIFPHHENEIAQAEALTGHTFATHWIHHGLLTINGQKMSKSLGNFITIKDALKKYHPDVLKIFFLQAHYSSPIDFSDKKMEEAAQAYERITTLKKKMDDACGDARAEDNDLSGSFKDHFLKYMDDDFNTPRGLSVLFDMITACNKVLDGHDQERVRKLTSFKALMKEISDIFGLTYQARAGSHISDEEVESMIRERKDHKAAKKFAEADAIRKDLDRKGVILEDTKDGTTWRRKL